MDTDTGSKLVFLTGLDWDVFNNHEVTEPLLILNCNQGHKDWIAYITQTMSVMVKDVT